MEYGPFGMNHHELGDWLKNLNPLDAASDDLVTQSQLYAFADMYGIRSLKALCLHKLHRDLLASKVQSDSIHSIVDLMVYAYQHTFAIEGKTVDTGEELRDLVITFAACNAGRLVNSPEFISMLNSGGEVVGDFAKAMAKRLG